MEPLTVTLAIPSALVGGAGGYGMVILEDFGSLFSGFAQAVAGVRSSSHKDPSMPRYIATGALAGGLLFGGVPAVFNHFTEAAQGKPVTMEQCIKSAPAHTSKIELATHEDGSKFCRFTP